MRRNLFVYQLLEYGSLGKNPTYFSANDMQKTVAVIGKQGGKIIFGWIISWIALPESKSKNEDKKLLLHQNFMVEKNHAQFAYNINMFAT